MCIKLEQMSDGMSARAEEMSGNVSVGVGGGGFKCVSQRISV